VTSYARTIGTSVDIRTVVVDKNRKSFSVFNKHATATVYMKEGGQVSTASGIPIYPKGSISLSVVEDGDTVKEAWSLVSDTITTPIVVFEGFE